MTSAELIAALQREDPEGTTPVVIDNCEVYSVQREAAFWDGKPLLLIQDKANPYYNITGAFFTSEGGKIVLTSFDLGDLLIDNPELPVEDRTHNKSKREYIEKRRAWAKHILASVDGKATPAECPECGRRTGDAA